MVTFPPVFLISFPQLPRMTEGPLLGFHFMAESQPVTYHLPSQIYKELLVGHFFFFLNVILPGWLTWAFNNFWLRFQPLALSAQLRLSSHGSLVIVELMNISTSPSCPWLRLSAVRVSWRKEGSSAALKVYSPVRIFHSNSWQKTFAVWS